MSYFKLIRHHIFKNNFRDALEVLKSQNNFELYYQFAPVLMQEVPKPLVNTLIDQGKKLGPLRLLPALVSCNGELHSLEVIRFNYYYLFVDFVNYVNVFRYLEFCIVKLKNSDKAIHNLLVSLYAKYDSKKLMEYLNSQGQEVSLVRNTILARRFAESI